MSYIIFFVVPKHASNQQIYMNPLFWGNYNTIWHPAQRNGSTSSRLCMVLNSNCASWSSISGSLPANGELEGSPPSVSLKKHGRKTTRLRQVTSPFKRDFSTGWTTEHINCKDVVHEVCRISISVETSSHVVSKGMAGRPLCPFFFTIISDRYFFLLMPINDQKCSRHYQPSTLAVQPL